MALCIIKLSSHPGPALFQHFFLGYVYQLVFDDELPELDYQNIHL